MRGVAAHPAGRDIAALTAVVPEKGHADGQGAGGVGQAGDAAVDDVVRGVVLDALEHVAHADVHVELHEHLQSRGVGLEEQSLALAVALLLRPRVLVRGEQAEEHRPHGRVGPFGERTGGEAVAELADAVDGRRERGIVVARGARGDDPHVHAAERADGEREAHVAVEHPRRVGPQGGVEPRRLRRGGEQERVEGDLPGHGAAREQPVERHPPLAVQVHRPDLLLCAGSGERGGTWRGLDESLRRVFYTPLEAGGRGRGAAGHPHSGSRGGAPTHRGRWAWGWPRCTAPSPSGCRPSRGAASRCRRWTRWP